MFALSEENSSQVKQRSETAYSNSFAKNLNLASQNPRTGRESVECLDPISFCATEETKACGQRERH